MKKVILLSVILFFTMLNVSMAQLSQINPIPSYNYHMTESHTIFQERGSFEPREKRDVNVVVTNSSDAGGDSFATIFLVEKTTSEVLGPYTIFCNHLLTVELPRGKWSVIVSSNWDLNVSVWIRKGLLEP